MSTCTFPPRDETLVFYNALDLKYRDDLQRLPAIAHAPQGTELWRTYVEHEGTAVWLSEYLRLRTDGQSHDQAQAAVFAEIDAIIHPLPPDPITPVHRIKVDGPIFRTVDGDPWRWKFVSAFKAPSLWAAGKQAELKAFAKWTRSVGANGWRVFLRHAYLSWPAIVPYEMPSSEIRPFIDWCASQGLYVELTILCDCQLDSPIAMTHEQQVDRVWSVLDRVARQPHVFCEIANEPHDNGVDPARIARDISLYEDRPVLMAMGLFPKTGSEPNFPVLDYIGDHPERKPSWPSEAGKTGYYQYAQCGVPSLADEPMKFSEPGADPEAGEQDPATSPNNAEDAGGGFGIGSAGATFHCRSGIDTVVPGPLETECAKRYFGAMDVFAADTALASYSHDGLSTHPLEPTSEAGEVASRIENNMRASIVAAQPTATWKAVPRDGWRIVETHGSRNNLLILER